MTNTNLQTISDFKLQRFNFDFHRVEIPVGTYILQLPPDPIELDLFFFFISITSFVSLPLASRYTSERGGRLVRQRVHVRETMIDSGIHTTVHGELTTSLLLLLKL